MKQDNKNRIIVVLGMHRSGTSAITRGLQTLGVDLGSNLMPPAPGNNEKGFYEDIEINKLNNELLNALNCDWHTLSLIPQAAFDNENLTPFTLRAIELVQTRIGDRPFGMKDPRIAQLFPFWHAVFKQLNIRPSYIIALRHAMSVAQSLKKRDGFDNAKCYYLWLEHVIPTILETVGTKRLVVDFDLLMADPEAQLKRVAQALDLSFNADSADLKEYIADFLDMKLRHSKFAIENLRNDPAVPLDVIRAHEMLSQLARDEINIDAPEIEQNFEHLNAGLLPLSPAFEYLTRLERKAVEQDGQITHLRNVEVDWIERGRHITNLEQIVADQTNHITNLEHIVIDQTTHITNLELVVAERNGQITDLNQDMANLLKSKSWRYTAPLRWLCRLFQ